MTSHAKTASTLPRPLPSGNFTDHCPDCGTTIVAATAEDVDAARCACRSSERIAMLDVELTCLLCGRGQSIELARLDQMRGLVENCTWPGCGGQLFPTAATTLYHRGNPAELDFDVDRPRRGRPRKDVA